MVNLLRSLLGSSRKSGSLPEGYRRAQLGEIPLPTELDLSYLDVIKWAPAWLTSAERLSLFTLVCALRPMNYLEVGTFQGGSTLIVSAAMDASNNPGRITCVEPEPQINPEHWSQIENRATLVQGYSPAVLSEAHRLAGQPFDFVFIDGDHTEAGVFRDAIGMVPFLSDDAMMLFHDGFFPDVAAAIDRFVSNHARHVVDIGLITSEATVQDGDPSLRWGGLRLLRFRR